MVLVQMDSISPALPVTCSHWGVAAACKHVQFIHGHSLAHYWCAMCFKGPCYDWEVEQEVTIYSMLALVINRCSRFLRLIMCACTSYVFGRVYLAEPQFR